MYRRYPSYIKYRCKLSVNNTEYTRSIVVVCHATVAASGDGGASRPVRRPADLDTDIERVRERGRDSTRRGRGGTAELTRARVYTRERFMGETLGTTKTSSRDPFHRPRRATDIPAREKENHPRNEAASILSGYPGFRNRFLKRARCGPGNSRCTCAQDCRIDRGEQNGWVERRIERESARLRRKEAKGDKKKERREEKQGNGEEMGFMWFYD